MTPKERKRLSELRVLWVSHGYGYGGDLMYFAEIFRECRERLPNMAVVVDGRTRYGNRYGIELLPWMRLLRLPLSRRTPGGHAYDTEVALPCPLLAWRLARSRAEVLIAIEFTLPALCAALAASLSRRTRLVLLVESDPAGRGGSASRLVRGVKRWAVRLADVVQTNNEPGRRYLVEQLGADPARVRVAPYLTSRPPGPAPSRDRGAGPLRILFANSLTPRKGLLELLDALAMLEPGDRGAIELTIAGEGPQQAEAERRAAGLAMTVRFLGRRPYAELGELYAAADVLAIPSLADYRSLAGFEGLAYGLALLASCHDGATAETLADGVNGFVVDPGDPAMLGERIARLAGDRDLVLAMQRASLALYQRRFSLEQVADNLAGSVLAAVADGAPF